MNCQNTNGRVDLLSPDTNTLFSMFDRIPSRRAPTSYQAAMTGNWYPTQLSRGFFSAANIGNLQAGLQKGVFEATNGQYAIDRQSEDELKIIMRGLFLLYSKNLPTGIPAQIAELNERVLDYAVPQLVGEVQGYVQYRIDASTMYSGGTGLLPPPMLASSKGQQLEFKSWF